MLKNYIKNIQLNRNTQVSFSGETIASYSFTGILNDSVTYGNNKTITQTYDDLLRLTSLNNGVQTYNYTYDDVNNITSDSVKNYSYDDVYRVVGVNNSASGTLLESFNYDMAGNRIADKNNEYNSNTLNQYTSLSGATLSGSLVYDNNGNLKQNSKYSFSYDYKNRLVKVTNSTGIVAEFKYDVLGRRYEKKVNNETVNYIYSDKNIIEEIRNNGTRNFKKEYINGLGIDNVIAFDSEENGLSNVEKEELSFCENTVLSQTGSFTKYGWNDILNRCNSLNSSGSLIGTNRYYLHKNHLGSVVAITNNSGSIVTEYDYDVFGKASIISGNDVGNTILFTGREFDKEIGLYYFRARYYDAELGRFINRDPIGQVDDVNLYGYVGNNGVMFVDPSGKVKKFIKENEGNAWYIDTSSPSAPLGDTGHAMLYYIYNGEEHIISFEPLNFDNGLFSDTNSFFDTSEAEIKRAKSYINKGDSVFISNEYIDASKVNDWFINESKNVPKYNTITNNCSTEIEKAIEAGGINMLTPIDSPWHLRFGLEQELTSLKFKKALSSYFNN